MKADQSKERRVRARALGQPAGIKGAPRSLPFLAIDTKKN